METTFLMIKPRAVADGLVGEIIAALEDGGFAIAGVASRRLTVEEASGLYEAHVGKPFFGALVEFMTSGVSIGILLHAPDAIAALRRLVGATKPSEAEPGTIRARFGKDLQQNAVHACDSAERVERESGFYFGDCPRAVVG